MPYTQVKNKKRKLFYTIASPDGATGKSGLTLLCIHGLGSSSSFYAPITSHLTSLGHTVLAIDTHGAGLSAPTGEGNTTTSIADDALAVLDSLAGQVPGDVVVLGHSMGGIVASEIASREGHGADRIKGVVLIGPVNPNPAAAQVFAKRIEVVAQGLSVLGPAVRPSATWNAPRNLRHG